MATKIINTDVLSVCKDADVLINRIDCHKFTLNEDMVPFWDKYPEMCERITARAKAHVDTLPGVELGGVVLYYETDDVQLANIFADHYRFETSIAQHCYPSITLLTKALTAVFKSYPRNTFAIHTSTLANKECSPADSLAEISKLADKYSAEVIVWYDKDRTWSCGNDYNKDEDEVRCLD